jgi:hypothetical protein
LVWSRPEDFYETFEPLGRDMLGWAVSFAVDPISDRLTHDAVRFIVRPEKPAERGIVVETIGQ